MSKFIEIGHGLKTIVDDDDYALLSKRKWHPVFNKNSKVCYAKSCSLVNGKVVTIRMHRLITCAPKGFVVDHINHDTLDNRKCNLRVVTQQGNLRNTRLLKNNTSGVCGVRLLKRKKCDRWKATIRVDGKDVYLGLFKSKEDAVLARLLANKKYGFHPNHGSE